MKSWSNKAECDNGQRSTIILFYFFFLIFSDTEEPEIEETIDNRKMMEDSFDVWDVNLLILL